jgi:hypothetical protein
MEVAVLWDMTALSGRCLLTFKVEQFPTAKTEAALLPASANFYKTASLAIRY